MGHDFVKKDPSDPTTTDSDAASPPGKEKISYVVGIGASAGGIEAFGDFIEALPEHTGMAFILIQHLDPTHESVLDQIFQRKTAVPVMQATEGMPVQPDHIYIIPPNKHICILDGKLTLTPRPPGKFMPIDTFMISLAESWGNKTIGVVLSGTGSDGTEGVKAIKAAGGFTFAQEEGTARYADMPNNAIAAGGVDFVLPPERIAREMGRIARKPLVPPAPHPEHADMEEESTDDLLQIYRLLHSATGVDFSNYKSSTIRRRIARRTMIVKKESLADYQAYLKEHPEEMEVLANDLFINVTSFFRDPEIFDLLLDSVLPELLAERHPDVPVRVWVPGCSTGEEVYSLAICLVEAAAAASSRSQIQIFATDISERVIERARAGLFPESIASDISKERLKRYFMKTDGGYQATKEIRDICIFARQDLTRDPPFSRMDIISCRNLLIYLAAPQQKKIIPTFHYSLNHNGILVLGSSESVGGFANLFTPIDKKYKVYRKKPAMPVLGDYMVPVLRRERGDQEKKPVADTVAFDAQKEADRILLASYAPASLLVNDQMDILQFRGATGRYVEPSSGTASLNLMRMLKESILLEVRALISQCRKQNGPVHRENVSFVAEEGTAATGISVVPIRPPNADLPRFFLLIFREPVQAAPRPETEPVFSDEAREALFEQVRSDLQDTREYLQATLEEKDAMNEEFRSAMEEIQSSNEELQSTNEELETTKEELQSTNEELVTVNEEMQNRNVELSRTNDDLINLLNNVSIPLVILTSDLKIRRYTAMAENLLNLIPSDVGRPFSDLRTKISFSQLEEMFNSVLDNLTPQEQEVQDRNGHWHRLRVRPYTTQGKKIDGLVMTLIDINDLKRSMEINRREQLFAEAIINTIREPLLVLDPNLRVSSANRSYYRFFRVSAAETEGNYIYNLGNGQWNIPRLRELLEEILPRDASFEDFSIDHDFPNVGWKRMVLNARRLHGAEFGNEEKILLAIEEARDTANE